MFDNPNFYKNLIDNLYDGIYFVDRDRTVTFWNRGAERITGYKSAYMMGKRCRDNILNHVTENGLELCAEHCPLAATMKDGKPREAEVYLHHVDGHRVPVLVRASPIYDQTGEIIGAVESFSDNTPRLAMRRKNEQLQEMVLVDPLTQIGNRRLVEIRLNAELGAYKESRQSFGVVFCDIDHFKAVNDTYGHETGDKVLQMVARTLRHSLRTTDVVARWGGEEFIALVNDVDEETLHMVANKLHKLVSQSRLDVDATMLSVTISMGATLAVDTDTIGTLVKRADQLMYASKNAGRNQITFG